MPVKSTLLEEHEIGCRLSLKMIEEEEKERK